MARHGTTLAAPRATLIRPRALPTRPRATLIRPRALPTRPGGTPAVGSSAPVSHALLHRRLIALVALLALSILLTVALGRVGAEAELADPVAGHAVVSPGDTLWEVAVDTAPNGVDPREHLAAIRELNGLDSSAVAPWTVVLLPAR